MVQCRAVGGVNLVVGADLKKSFVQESCAREARNQPSRV